MPMDLFRSETGKIETDELPSTRKSYPSRSSLFIDNKTFDLLMTFRALPIGLCWLMYVVVKDLDIYINKSFVHSKFACLFIPNLLVVVVVNCCFCYSNSFRFLHISLSHTILVHCSGNRVAYLNRQLNKAGPQ